MIYDMYMKSDMLSARKIKLHGMSTTRWTTKDKITQFKGLIHLYQRDKKVVAMDKNTALKRDRSTVITLKKMQAVARVDLDNAIMGDRQAIRNLLAGRHVISYHNLHVETIMEYISQNIFHCRKQYDLLKYKETVKRNKLIQLKLLHAEMEDRLITTAAGKFPIEMQCKILTSRVHDANLKKEATIVIHESYKKILNVCKKDAIYFDVILNSLRDDRIQQGKCLRNAIILGQLATEYLCDRKDEFQVLEKMIQRDMLKRETELEEVMREVKRTSKTLKCSVRRESDMTLPIQYPFSNIDIRVQISTLCKKLDILKNSFLANNYVTLLDCLKEQQRQAERLVELQQKFINGRDILLRRIEHSALIYEDMYNTIMLDTTFEYKDSKQSLKNRTEKKIEKIMKCKHLQKKNCNLIVKIKSSLQHLEQIYPYEVKQVRMQKSETIEAKALDIKKNCSELLEVLTLKLTMLSKSNVEYSDSLQQDVASKNLERLMLDRTKRKEIEEHIVYQSLIENNLVLQDSAVPTRADIKATSKEIVLANTVNDDLIPVFAYSRPRRRWKKK
ncbi:hypothetical protein QE152_g30022 [Popillia japonica]|uniref:Uncharacterized protein n=1 Tax=Popillia japonica TaxID=7064 RepID=A0AAW1JFJ0_POPJA